VSSGFGGLAYLRLLAGLAWKLNRIAKVIKQVSQKQAI